MSFTFDENGRPYIILREQEKKKRVKGLEAHKVSQSFHRQINSESLDTLVNSGKFISSGVCPFSNHMNE